MITQLRLVVGICLVSFVITAVSAVAAGTIISRRHQEAEIHKAQIENPVSKLTNPDSAPASQELTASVVAAHNTPTDCWMIISNQVYALTSFLNSHPGGSLVMTPYCGKNGTQAFNTKDKQPATSHSSVASSLLAKYLLGSLGQSLPANLASPLPGPTLTPNHLSLLPTSPTSTPRLGTTTNATNSVLTTTDVASHNSPSNCWLIISSRIYNVTSYLTSHPGGVAVISKYCGQDSTGAFQTKDGQGNAHSAFAVSLLNNYYVGTIGSPPAGNPSTATNPLTPPNPTLAANQPTSAPLPTLPPSTTLTASEVAGHNTSSNCWLIISSKVYNVTNYLTSHPGGVGVISKYCGQDSTQPFNTKDGRGSNHSNTAQNLLTNYFLGNLGSTVSPTSTPIPGQPTPTTGSSNNSALPAAVAAKYPGATILSKSIEDDGRIEMKINYQGQCRDIKLNSSGVITQDKGC